MAESRQERIARNEAGFRSLNESLGGQVHDPTTNFAGFVCECGDMECAAIVRVDVARYEEVRSDPHLFIVEPGHEIPDVEDVVGRADGFLVVRKHDNVSDVVRETNPRE
ncbi:MAG: hypothetical protein ABI950_11685 [Solirubrobacteraceae bacterium]